jgi:molecular chaperone DnaJ
MIPNLRSLVASSFIAFSGCARQQIRPNTRTFSSHRVGRDGHTARGQRVRHNFATKFGV